MEKDVQVQIMHGFSGYSKDFILALWFAKKPLEGLRQVINMVRCMFLSNCSVPLGGEWVRRRLMGIHSEQLRRLMCSSRRDMIVDLTRVLRRDGGMWKDLDIFQRQIP